MRLGDAVMLRIQSDGTEVRLAGRRNTPCVSGQSPLKFGIVHLPTIFRDSDVVFNQLRSRPHPFFAFLTRHAASRRICPKVRMRVRLHAVMVSTDIWSTRLRSRTCWRRPKIDHGGCGGNLGLGYVASPRLARYSRGLSEPREILIRFSLYQWIPPSRPVRRKRRPPPWISLHHASCKNHGQTLRARAFQIDRGRLRYIGHFACAHSLRVHDQPDSCVHDR